MVATYLRDVDWDYENAPRQDRVPYKFKMIRTSINDMMANTTIDELAIKLLRGESVLTHK